MRPLYAGRGVVLYHGDCIEGCELLTTAGVKADLLLSDPPYGMVWAGRYGDKPIRADGSRQGMRVVRQMLQTAPLADDAHLYLFCHWESYADFTDVIAGHARPKNMMIWEKGGSSMGDTAGQYAVPYELVIYAQRGVRALASPRESAILRYAPVPVTRRIHPTEKPVELLRYLIRKSCPAEGIVFDPFAGSGSTLEAALREGREAVGFELDEHHAQAAAARLAALELS